MKLTNINKIYNNKNTKVHALKNISLTIEETGMIFIIGASGCGKTTLINILSNKDSDYQGTVECNGNIETIEQEIMLIESMSVIDNLLMVSQDENRILDMLSKFQMNDYRYDKVKKLSIGQKKRVQIMRSLLVEASYYVCDEPTAALDHQNIEIVMNAFVELAREKAIIIVTHDIALVDMYATRRIEMDNGIIVEDIHIFKGKPIVDYKYQIKKTNIQQVIYMLKMFILHPIERFGKGILIFLLILSIFVSSSLFTSLQTSSINKDKWTYSKNVIITQPTSKKQDEDKETYNSGMYVQYDVYDKQSIRLVRDNIPEVIGYRYGWSLTEYDINGSFAPDLNIDDLKHLVDEEDRRMLETGNPPCQQYDEWKSILQDIEERYPDGDFPKDIVLSVDFRNYEGFKKNEDNGYEIPFDYQVTLGQKGTSVVPYQIFPHYDMHLQVGSIPVKDNEVVLSNTLAKQLCKELNINRLEDLIGKKTTINISGYHQLIEVIVSGVFYEGSVYENQIYFQEGVWDQKVEDIYQMIPEKVKYLYVYFLCDEKFDSNEVAVKIRQVLGSADSTFASYNDSIFIKNEPVQYQNPMYFYIFALFVFIALALLYVIMQYIVSRRTRKEMSILTSYGYNHTFILYFSTAIVLCISGIVQICMLAFVCQKLNELANTLGFASIIEYSVTQYLVALFIAGILLLIEERGYYVFSIKRRK